MNGSKKSLFVSLLIMLLGVAWLLNTLDIIPRVDCSQGDDCAMRPDSCSRRQFLARSSRQGLAACSMLALGGGSLAGRLLPADDPPGRFPRGKADSCIFIWLGGGACHIDMWDPKEWGDGKKKAGSYYDAIPTAIPDVSVCQHLSRVAPLLDRGVIIRSLHHNVFDEHAAATNMLHTGRATSGTGWDTHNEGQLKQHELIESLDRALAALIFNLDQKKILDRTLVVVATEFGRPPEFDAGGGRGHHSKAFSVLLAGGSLRTGQVVGETDELGREMEDRPVSVPDLHGTIHCALGINPAKELYDAERPVPITDRGEPVRELFA